MHNLENINKLESAQLLAELRAHCATLHETRRPPTLPTPQLSPHQLVTLGLFLFGSFGPTLSDGPPTTQLEGKGFRQLLDVGVGWTVGLEQLVAREVDVSLVVRVVDFAELAEGARWACFERILVRESSSDYYRFFLGILNLLLEL